MKEKLPYCLQPWIHYHIGNAGKVKACCVANIPLGDSNQQTFQKIWDGEEIELLRNKFERGESDPRCRVCQRLEDAGGKSIRQEVHEKFDHIFLERKHSLPFTFDIRFSNTCNFRCRTCWHGASSAWFAEAKQLKRNLGNKAVLQNVHDFDRFIEQTGDALLKAKEIYFAGGEPLVTKEHYLLLEWLVKNNATDIHLRYNTNFSKLSFDAYQVIDYWKHFSKIEILSSIDAQGSLGEYIRKGFSWQQFQENRKLLRNLSNIKFLIAPTISVFSIANLPDLYQTCLEQEIIEADGLYINILDRPLHYNVKALPVDVKERVQAKYHQFYLWAEQNQIPCMVIDQLKECEHYMISEDLSKQWHNFKKETKQFDEMRSEKVKGIESLFLLI